LQLRIKKNKGGATGLGKRKHGKKRGPGERSKGTERNTLLRMIGKTHE